MEMAAPPPPPCHLGGFAVCFVGYGLLSFALKHAGSATSIFTQLTCKNQF